MRDPVQVRQMFARVAPRYDLANEILSCGVHRLWRRAAVRRAAVRPGERALDVCAGTGDLSLALRRAGAEVTASDFCPEMLRVARRKERPDAAPRWVLADALCLPFAAGSFDLATAAFGVRNLRDPLRGLEELRRVLRPGGRLLVLEFCRPRAPLWSPLYLFYFRRVLPRLGRWIARDRGDAYGYLQESVMAFPEREAFVELMRRAGLARPTCEPLALGLAALYRGEVPD